jgi:stage III sporulation protein AH
MMNVLKKYLDKYLNLQKDNNLDGKTCKMKKVSFWDKLKFKKLNFKEKRKLNLQKIKETALVISAFVLIGVGYLNFSNNNESGDYIEKIAKSTNNIGDVQLVSSNSAIVENDENIDNTEDLEKSEVVETVKLVENDSSLQNSENEAVSSSSEASSNDDILSENQEENISNAVKTTSVTDENEEYFAELKLERNDMYSKSLETYQKIVDSSSISSEQKSIAIQEIEKINEMQNGISVAEELIKLKGFEDVVIYCNNDTISVIVRVAVLSETQVAQIQNIVSRELGTQVSNINISNK